MLIINYLLKINVMSLVYTRSHYSSTIIGELVEQWKL